MFGRKKSQPVTQTEVEIATALAAHVESVIKTALAGEVERLTESNAGEKERLAVERELAATRKELTDLSIRRDQEVEKHARTQREIEHKVGLHKKQVELEITAAKKETELQVKEENLKAEKERFEKEIAFMRERFETEVGYLREMMGEVLNRLPNVEVTRTYETVEHIGDKPKALTRAPKS